MKYTNTYICIFFLILFYMFYISLYMKKLKIYNNNNNNKQFVAYTPDKPPNLHIFFNDKVLIYRAIEDIRYNRIRILAAFDLNIDNSTIIVRVNNKKIKYEIEVLGLLILFNRQFTLKYVNILFQRMKIYNLTVNDEEIEYTPVKEIKYKYDFTLCINSVRNNFTAKTMIDQTLSIYQKEGVSHAIIYYGDISKEVYTVLDKYVKSGFLEIYYWPELEILSYIRNYGQILKMNDCLYRSYYNSKYIINSDIDEIIMPKKFNTIQKLINFYLKIHPKCGIFYFWNKYFPINNFTDKIIKISRESYLKLPPIKDCDLFTKTLSCNENYKGKYIISTQKVVALRIHDAITTDVDCRINKGDGYVRHTRVKLFQLSKFCNNLVVDETILHFK